MNASHPLSHNDKRTSPMVIVLFWLYVGIPLAWGVWSTSQKVMALFH